MSTTVHTGLGLKRRRPPASFRAAFRTVVANWSRGALTVVHPHGPEIALVGAGPGPRARMVIHDYRCIPRILSHGLIGFADGYLAGEWDTPDLPALLVAFSANLDQIHKVISGNPLGRLATGLLHALNANTRAGSRRNIAAHYDLGNDFYSLWLDPSMTYSAGRFDGTAQLEQAQAAKYAALARLIGLEASHHVLEIGCGWGGFAEFAARETGARVTAITISPAQHAYTQARMARAGLSDRVEVRLVDYRDVEGSFDRVVSIEMFEAVGERYWPVYFQRLAALLKPGGLAGLQVISIRDDLFEDYRRQADFIQRYVFPGGMLPSDARLRQEIGRAGLSVRGVEAFGAGYAATLALWRERFDQATEQVRDLGFDARFIRMWRFYLAYCEAGFRTGRTDVAQWVLSAASL